MNLPFGDDFDNPCMVRLGMVYALVVLELSHFTDEFLAQGISDWPIIHETRAREPGPAVSKSSPRKVIISSMCVGFCHPI